MNFHIGQKVVCINATPPPEGWKNGYDCLIKDEIYTISSFTHGGIACHLLGFNCQREGGMFLERFVSLESKQFTDELIEELELAMELEEV